MMHIQEFSLRNQGQRRRTPRLARLLAAGTAICLLAACENGQMPAFMQKKDAGDTVTRAKQSVTLVERDVEAPDVFQVTEAGLWDGRPSLGGVWVAHPDVTEPERVIIRNPENGKFVIGALFRKERSTPGPRLQVSSDAASALNLVAGQPNNLNVTALRREQAAETPDTPDAIIPASLDAPDNVTATELDPVTASATAAIDAASVQPVPAAAPSAETASIAPEAIAPAPAPVAKPAASAGGLSRAYLQIGIFSVEENANNTAATMRSKGLIPTVKKHSSKGKTFWRVVVGPATTASERAELLDTIKAAGFTDAYAVNS